MPSLTVGIYARVSSDQQAKAGTISSQVAALKGRVQQDGLELKPEHCFIDDGFSGATLIRPELERLRDTVALGGLQRLYLHSPDRLARNYVYQMLLLEEFSLMGLEVRFLSQAPDESAEGKLLLQVQGMMAEYERAKIGERCRRGKIYSARRGQISAIGHAPYGYRYIPAQMGGEARYEVVLDEAAVVRRIFRWLGTDRLSVGEVTRRLCGKVATRHGGTHWDRTTVWGMLTNPAYFGSAAFGRTARIPWRPPLRTPRGHQPHPRDAHSIQPVPAAQWIRIAVPALITEDLFQAAQAQLAENRRRTRSGARGARYLLQGLTVCQKCGRAYCGRALGKRSPKYWYYRCTGSEGYRFGGARTCWNKPLGGHQLEEAVWKDVCELMSNPNRISIEHKRRLEGNQKRPEFREAHAALQHARRGETRLWDAYTEELLSKAEFTARLAQQRTRIERLMRELKEAEQHETTERDLRLVIGKLEEFAARVKNGLANAAWRERREIIRGLVKQIEICDDVIRVVYRVGLGPTNLPGKNPILHHCGDSATSPLGLYSQRSHSRHGPAETRALCSHKKLSQ